MEQTAKALASSRWIPVKASVIVVVHAGAARLDDAVASLAPTSGRADVEVVVVDNGSADRCSELAERRFPWAKVVRSERNLGFAGGANLGAEAASGEVLILLNDDAAAEEGFVEAHLQALESAPRAAASAGRLLSWDGARHDFVRGAATFDCHAFQIGQGFALDELPAPEQGEPVPFACGGNMAVRAADWYRQGGLDEELFAYFEDVELGWRLWAAGREIVAAPSAVARHRGSATSDALGAFRRGVLFERNALRVFFSCADSELREALSAAVLMTFLHRLVRFAEENPELAATAADPFGAAAPPLSRAERWRRRWRERGAVGALRHLAGRAILGPSVGIPQIRDGRLLMQLRAAHGFFEGQPGAAKRRATLEAQRHVPDREILTRFPRLIVPTYPGDEGWFASESFRSLVPAGWGFEEKRLDEVLHSSVLGR